MRCVYMIVVIGGVCCEENYSSRVFNKTESCAIAKMTARCALYKWIE